MDRSVPRPPCTGVETSWSSVQVDSGGVLELEVLLMKSRRLICCVDLEEVPSGLYCCVRVLHVIRIKGSDWFSHQWPDSVAGIY